MHLKQLEVGIDHFSQENIKENSPKFASSIISVQPNFINSEWELYLCSINYCYEYVVLIDS